jgi:hypothetical protein
MPHVNHQSAARTGFDSLYQMRVSGSDVAKLAIWMPLFVVNNKHFIGYKIIKIEFWVVAQFSYVNLSG